MTGTTNTTRALPGFWCENKGHIGAYIPFMYVNDGVCDHELCCDGTDESLHVGGTKCENRCASIGKEYRRIEEERRQSKERSANRRRTLVKEARELRRRVENKVATLKEELANLEVQKAELQRKYDEVERAERGKVVKAEGEGGKLGVLVGLAKKRVDELRDTLDKVLDQRDDLQDRVEQLEDILSKLKEEYNPNFNDEGVKAAVQGYENYAAGKSTSTDKKSEVVDADVLEVLKEDGPDSGINWAEFQEEETSDADIGMYLPHVSHHYFYSLLTKTPVYNLEAYLPPSVRSFIHSKISSLKVWLIENGILADNPTTGGPVESKLVIAAREALEAARAEHTTKTTQLSDEERDLAKDYGPDDIFRALKGQCVSSDVGEYEYELCWFDRTTQKSKKGHGNTNMGNFERITTEIADEEDRVDGKGLGKGPRMVLRYENGQGCWNGPQRSTAVWLACAEKDELWRVSESEKCVYKMEVGTPAACEAVAVEVGAGAKGHDEL